MVFIVMAGTLSSRAPSCSPSPSRCGASPAPAWRITYHGGNMSVITSPDECRGPVLRHPVLAPLPQLHMMLSKTRVTCVDTVTDLVHLQLLSEDVCVLSEHHHGCHQLAPGLVLQPHHGHVQDGGVGQQHCLHVQGRDPGVERGQ